MFGMLQGIANIFTTKKANKELNKLLNQQVTYQKSPYAAQQLGLAQQMFGGRAPGAAQQEQNILSNQANYNANLQRNATDSSQLLAMAAAGQGQTNAAFQDLGIQEQQNKMNMLQNLNNAYGGMAQQDLLAYQDKVRQFNDLAAIRGAQTQNRASAVNGVFNGLNSDFNDAMSILGIASGGGLGSLFGGGAKK